MFGIDALQALYLAIQFAGATLEASECQLEWLGQKGDLGLPRFFPNVPRWYQSRLERVVEREAARFYADAERLAPATIKKSRRHRRTSE